jgi:hypothetical protein
MKNLDMLLRKVELFERLAVYGDRKSFLQALAQDNTWSDIARQEGDLPEDHSIPAPSETKPSNIPEITVPGKPATTSAGPSISPASLYAVQNYINKDMINDLPPIKPDGIWGTETAKRVLEWGKKNNLNFGIQQLLDMAKARSTGAGIANQINPGSNLEQSKKYL